MKQTTRKYNVQGSQIWHWNKRLKKFENEEGIRSSKKKYMISSRILHDASIQKDMEKYNELKLDFKNLPNMDRVVTVLQMMKYYIIHVIFN